MGSNRGLSIGGNGKIDLVLTKEEMTEEELKDIEKINRINDRFLFSGDNQVHISELSDEQKERLEEILRIRNELLTRVSNLNDEINN